MLCTQNLASVIIDTDYLGRSHSDHNPLLMQLSWDSSPPAVPPWRLRPELLEDAAFRASLSAAIPEYFEHNDGMDLSGVLEWDAFKVFIRGHCLGTQCDLRRSIERDLARVERDMLRPEREVAGSLAEESMLSAARAEHL
ncbi:hypothetical protein NDU88_007780 [Pleurodeles waltl]|uniref:Endonuclease/exonuclease/phosphatase domain-containing protein n=1 Tax=Pleurodeles waltl TaxID=8319 RepID=A0AAV7STG0_PLEWA|nr:hypothetical protein NDU88_007780 [Pleurodeles waltl]